MPTKMELIKELQKLKEVSAKNETLTRQLGEGKGDSKKLHVEIQKCIDEQSRIVDTFVSLSENNELVSKFKGIVKEIEGFTAKLEKETDADKAKEIKDSILKGIETWIKCLESIITDVIAKTK